MIMVAAMVLSLAACKNEASKDEKTTVASANIETSNTETTTEDITSVVSTNVSGTTPAEITTAIPASATTVSSSLPVTNTQILAAYTTVMDKAKADKPAYHRIYFQTLPADTRKVTGGGINLILKLAAFFMTSEEKARKDPEINEKNSEMKMFPVANCDKGCLLTNVNAIRSANFVKLANGNYKIIIILKDEMNSEPYKSGNTAPSNVGSMFYPLSKSIIDNTLTNDSKVSWAVSNVSYSLKYYDSTAVLEYNPNTNQIVTLEQYLHTFIMVKSAKVLLSNISGSAVLHYTVICNNFVY
jgi:hypothetical protein